MPLSGDDIWVSEPRDLNWSAPVRNLNWTGEPRDLVWYGTGGTVVTRIGLTDSDGKFLSDSDGQYLLGSS